MVENLQLLQTLTSRIIHDLAGSIGTIDNCLSLSEAKNKAIQQKASILANQESTNLVNKIQCFRSIYGVLEGDTSISAIFVRKLLNDSFMGNIIKPKLHFEEGILYFDAFLAKASVCLAMIATECISTIGEMSIFFGNDKSDNVIKISVNGKNLRFKKDSSAILIGDKVDEEGKKLLINVANCREHYVNILCTNAKYKILVDQKEDFLEYSMVKC